MSKLVWDQDGERLYETGIEQGVLYPKSDEGTYPKGYAWNGLTGVSEAPSGAEETALYADNIKYLSLTSTEEFGATITAYTYPEEFEKCDGSADIAPGVTVGQQDRVPFGLVYKTKLGNDTKGNRYGYKLNLIYGAKAKPSSKDYKTINDSPEAIEMSWEISTTPIKVPGFKVTAHLTIDSTKANPAKLAKLEDILFGSETSDARLPFPAEIIEIMKGEPDPALSIAVSPITGNTDLLGKKASDLQSNIVINDTTMSISGTLKHVTGYTGFSSNVDEQSGNYIALNVDPEAGFPESMTVEVKNGTSGPSKITAEDHQVVLKIKDTATQGIIIKATNNGSEVTKEYNFVGLTLQSA